MSPKTPAQFQVIREKSKEHLVEVSMRLFATDGYQNTSISKIAKEAGVAKGALYHYFESKESLLIAVIEKGLHDIENLFFETAKEGMAPKEQLKQLVLKTFDSMKQDKDFWALYASLMTQMRATTTMRQIFEPMVQGTFDMLTRLFEACEIPNARMRALSIGAMMDGIGMHYLFVKKDYPIDEVANYIVNDLLFPSGE